MKNTNKNHVITANAFIEGWVVYLTKTGHWHTSLMEAAVIDDLKKAQSLLAIQQQSDRVLDPYLLKVEFGVDGSPHPTQLRDRIRASGPSHQSYRTRLKEFTHVSL